MASADADAVRAESPRAAIAAATINVAASRTMSCPTPNPGGGTGIVPTMPPIAFARAPSSTSHGSQALTARTAAQNATSQPGRRRAMA